MAHGNDYFCLNMAAYYDTTHPPPSRTPLYPLTPPPPLFFFPFPVRGTVEGRYLCPWQACATTAWSECTLNTLTWPDLLWPDLLWPDPTRPDPTWPDRYKWIETSTWGTRWRGEWRLWSTAISCCWPAGGSGTGPWWRRWGSPPSSSRWRCWPDTWRTGPRLGTSRISWMNERTYDVINNSVDMSVSVKGKLSTKNTLVTKDQYWALI